MRWLIQPWPLGHQFLGFPLPVPVGRPPGLNGVGAAVEEPFVRGRGDPAVGVCGDLVGGAGLFAVGGDDAAYQLGGVVAGTAAHDVQAVGLFGVFVLASAIRSYR